MKTNDEQPFVKKDIIVFAGDYYQVVENFGDRGTVIALDDGYITVSGFKWKLEGVSCKQIYNKDDVPLGIYRFHWHSGGSSVASIYQNRNGELLIAPTNWIAPGLLADVWEDIRAKELIALK